LLPEAVHAFTGIDMTTYVNRSLPFDEVFDSDWRAMAQQVLAAPDHAQRIKLIEDFIEPRWMAARGYRSDGGGMWASRLRDYVSDYIAGMPVRMLASEFGKSLRQIERRIKAQTGLTLQRRLRMLRDEHRFTAARSSMESGASLADIAADSGYADQAHFSRETRRATGMTPNEVKYRAASEESYWVYRIWS
jgi:AraC-like DNA-binding protein